MYIPYIPCSSCVWVLENQDKLHSTVTSSQVDLLKKTVRVSFNTEKISLKEIVVFYASQDYSITAYKGLRSKI